MKIIHVDMDQFFAAVEQRDNPELKGKPIAVGHDAERGVVSTASYEATIWVQNYKETEKNCYIFFGSFFTFFLFVLIRPIFNCFSYNSARPRQPWRRR